MTKFITVTLKSIGRKKCYMQKNKIYRIILKTARCTAKISTIYNKERWRIATTKRSSTQTLGQKQFKTPNRFDSKYAI